VGQKLRSRAAPALRIGASEIFLRDYLPAVLGSMRRRYPQLRLVLRSAYQEQMQTWLQDRVIDVAVTTLESRPPARLHCLKLVEVPLALLVPTRSPIKNAADLWGRDKLEEPLISLPDTETIARNFQKGLKKLGVEWPVSIEASSMDLVARYVTNGYGIGVNVHLPGALAQSRIRSLPLEGFEPVPVAMLWHDETNPLVRAMLEETRRQVSQLWPNASI
jgi:DNA-binding transcriptional LysR family regulator